MLRLITFRDLAQNLVTVNIHDFVAIIFPSPINPEPNPHTGQPWPTRVIFKGVTTGVTNEVANQILIFVDDINELSEKRVFNYSEAQREFEQQRSTNSFTSNRRIAEERNSSENEQIPTIEGKAPNRV